MSDSLPGWVQGLSQEDWAFLKRLLLASGSLKEVARQYGISYPTVRIRLNRLIEKVRILESEKEETYFHKKVRLLIAEGRLDLTVARTLIKAFEDSSNERDENGNMV